MSDTKYPVLCLSVALDAVNQARIERFMLEWLALLDQAQRDAVALWNPHARFENPLELRDRIVAYRAALRDTDK